jgi:hypothetical protein
MAAEEPVKPAQKDMPARVVEVKKPSKRPPPSLGKAPLAPRRQAAADEPVAEEKSADEQIAEKSAEPAEQAGEEKPAANGNGEAEPAKDGEAASRLAFKLRRKGQRKDQPPAAS